MSRISRVAAALISAACAVPLMAAPARMQAAVQTADGLHLQTTDTPGPGAGQVLIRVYAAGVNPVDWKRRATIPGFDAAGVIDSVGSGVTAWKAGDPVVARVNAGYAEYAVANADETIRKPASFTFEQAGGIPVAGIAGYVLADSGKRYVIVAIVNHPNANAARPALDALVQWAATDSRVEPRSEP